MLFHDPSDPLFTRPTMMRLFCAVRAVERDVSGRATEAEVYYLDSIACRPGWHEWSPEHTLHMHPFKLRLRHTARAGLHVTSEWLTPAGEMRYGSNFMLRSEGLFVLNPSCVLEAGELLEDAVSSGHERMIVERNLKARFGLRSGVQGLAELWAERCQAPVTKLAA